MPKLTVNCHILLKSFFSAFFLNSFFHSQARVEFGSQWMNSTSTTVCTFPNSSKAEVSDFTALCGGWHGFKAFWNTSHFILGRQWPLCRDLRQPFPPRADCDTLPAPAEQHQHVGNSEPAPRHNSPVKSEPNLILAFLKMSGACHDSKMGWIQVPCWLQCATPCGKQVLPTSSFSYQK